MLHWVLCGKFFSLLRAILVSDEICMFAEDTLWTGIPGDYTNPNAPEALSAVRKLVDSGKYAEATKEAVKLTANPTDVCYCIILLSYTNSIHICRTL